MEPLLWTCLLFLTMVVVHEFSGKKTIARSTTALHDIHRESEKLVCRIVPGQKRKGDSSGAVGKTV